MYRVNSGQRVWLHAMALAALVLALAGCGAAGLYREANKQFDAGEYVEAVEHYRRAAEAAPGNVEYQQRYLLKQSSALEILFRRAEAARLAGNLTEAETQLRLALQVDPGNAAASEGMRRVADARRHSARLEAVDELIAAGELEQAESMLRTVLAEAPDNARAQNSLARLRAAREEGKAGDANGMDARFQKPVTLEFRDVPVKAAFDVLSKASGLNFVYDQEIRPDLKVSINLRKTPLREAIRLLGIATQLETRVLNSNSMLVYPNTPQKVSDYRELNVRSFYLANADAKKVAESLKTILKTESIVVDEKLNLLMMRDSPEAIRLAEKLIALQDIGEPEVMLDVEILEIKQSKLLDMGVNLPSEIGLSVVPADQASSGIPLSDLRGLGASDINALVPNGGIKLNDERSNARILANPKIRVKSKEKASVLIGDKVPVITSTSTSTGFVAETVSYVDVGLKLEVEPTVYSDDEVSIKILLEVSNLVREILSQSGTLSYQIGTRNAQTVLRLRDGETQILAGLINKEDRRVGKGWPGLSRFPVLNRLFGTQKNDRQDTEIVLSITPRLIRGVRRADMDELEFASGTATRLGGRVAATPAAESDESSDGTASRNGGAEVKPLSDAPAAPSQVTLEWSVPSDVRVGEQFTAILNVTALKAIDRLSVMIGFDPQVLQAVVVEEGSFLSQGSATTSFVKDVDPQNGKLTATVLREGSTVSGQGGLLQITFKALKAAGRTRIRLLSAEPGPAEAGAAGLADAEVQVR